MSKVVWLRLSGNQLTTLDGLGWLLRLRWAWLADNPFGADAAPVGATPARTWTDLNAWR